MRVFIGLTLDESFTSLLESLQTPFRVHAQRGNFTDKMNFHLTLAFIGDVSDETITDLEVFMDELDFDPFELQMGQLGSFKRKDGLIWWIGLQQSQGLVALRHQIVLGLKAKDIPFDESTFMPHLTLVRNYKASTDRPLILPDYDPPRMLVKRVSLMKSAREHGELRYTEIYHHDTQRTP